MATKKPRDRDMSAIDLLKADHKRMRTALAKLEKATGPAQRTDLLALTKRMIVRHSKGEESVLYPAFRDAARTKADSKLFLEAHEEHHLVDVVIAELEGATSDGSVFAAKAKVLRDLVEHHAEEEETQMFPRARTLLGVAALKELGARLRELDRAPGVAAH